MKNTQSQQPQRHSRKVLVMTKAIFILSLILSGCGQKKTVGYKGQGPASVPAPAPQDTSTGTGGIADGPHATPAPGPKSSTKKKTPKKSADSKEPSSQGSVSGSAPVVTAPAPAAPAPVAKTPGKKVSLGPWFAPQIADSPAESWMENEVLPLLKRVEQAAPAPAILSRKIRVTLALGYFDGYHAKEDLRYDNHSYGPNTPVDPWLRAITENLLERQCRGNEQLCGFERVGDSGVATMFRRAGYDDIIQEITVISAALTTNHDRNTHLEEDRQLARSEAAEAAFLKSIKTSDLVVYVGHSRLGGGPDFFPPRLTDSGEVDYDSYIAEKHGIQALSKALRESKNSGTVAILSCDSTKLFLGRLQKAAPNRNFVTMNGIVESQDLLSVGLASVDLYLRRAQVTGISQVLSSNAQLSRQATLTVAR